MEDDSKEIYEAYKAEVAEILTQMRRSYETLKKRFDTDTLNDIARSCHKLKGAAGMMDYSHTVELAKEMESVFKLIIGKKLELKPETINILSEGLEMLTKYVQTDFDDRDEKLLEKLRKLYVNL